MGERRNEPMGAKVMKKVIATLIAVTMIMVSGIGVFAAGSNTGGATAPETTVTPAAKSITVANTNGEAVKYKLSTAKKYKTAKSAVIKVKKGKKYIIKVGSKTYKVLTAKGKIKSIKLKNGKLTVKFSKKKGAKKYVITAVGPNGQIKKWTVKKTTKKIKLPSSGQWNITVTPKNGAYRGAASAARTVTVG